MKMTEMTQEMIEVMDEMQALVIKEMMDADVLADIAGEEGAIKALALATKTLKMTKNYALVQADITDKTYDRIERIERIVEATAENQRYISCEVEELKGKIDKLIKEFEKLNEPTVKED